MSRKRSRKSCRRRQVVILDYIVRRSNAARPFSSKKAFGNGDELREIVKKYCNNVEKDMEMIEQVYGIPINTWNVSKVKDFEAVFKYQENFNEDIGDWDVSNATSFKWMFFGATTFNQPLENWNTKNVRNMAGMFMGAEAFNQPLGFWDTSSLMRVHLMFWGAKSFNQDLTGWDLRKIAKPRGMLVETPYAHTLPNKMDPAVVFDEHAFVPEPTAKNTKNIPVGFSYAPCMPAETQAKYKTRCLGCKTEIYHDEPRIRFRHVLEKDQKCPRIDQCHCVVACLQSGLSLEQYDEFIFKKWKCKAVKDLVLSFAQAKAEEDEDIAKLKNHPLMRKLGWSEDQISAELKAARKSGGIHTFRKAKKTKPRAS